MVQINITFRKDSEDYIRWLADLLDLSISDVVNDFCKHMMDEDLEEDIWGDKFKDAKDDWDEMVESSPEARALAEEEPEFEEGA